MGRIKATVYKICTTNRPGVFATFLGGERKVLGCLYHHNFLLDRMVLEICKLYIVTDSNFPITVHSRLSLESGFDNESTCPTEDSKEYLLLSLKSSNLLPQLNEEILTIRHCIWFGCPSCSLPIICLFLCWLILRTSW